ncbi:VanZ family protein [Alkalihalobacillus sp. AL-G]|uniref:VanZ family protein n=1 Tax=Alkalihalobacillus sp. AL-G TaxID=2926399 RepID=UPI00272D89F2|nr:VanZ family protein [Alkalihalobacillus sp. AL-G]WLD93022.1 VanZ family protein [Alkalihalobacillus sp. AL-G]
MKKFLKYWMPVIIWAGIIFYASSQPYEEQDLKPFLSDEIPLGWVETYFGDVSFHYAGEEVSVDHLGKASFVEFFIRKGAHVTVYLVLAFLLYRALYNTSSTSTYTARLAIGLGILYAASDEYHQSFTVNRSPHIEDVLLDTVGIIIGTLLAKFTYSRM